MDNSSLPADKVLYLPQEMTEQEGIDLLDEVRSLPPETLGRVMQVIAALGIDPERLLATKGCTPGEARKLKIAYGLGSRVWLLILDEPANHLDLPSVERLEAAFKEYPGALIMVSHEVRLARECTSLTWRIENNRVSIANEE
jgi:ATPase subunit of ABC transporter with duplicated ATPase domains